MGTMMLSFRKYLSEKAATGGFDYEHSVNAKLKQHGLQPENVKSAGSSADAPDGSIHAGGKHHNLEIKKDKGAMMGQLELKHSDEKGWHISDRSKTKYPKTAAHIEKHFLPDVNKKWKKPSGDYDTDLKMGNVYKDHPNTDPIKDHYGKDRKTPYMQIGKSGLHHTGSDEGRLGVPELNGKTQFRARMKYRGTNKKTGKKEYGSLVTFNLKDHKPSSVDIDKHAEELGKKHGMK
jgi:hypothetical protein